MAGGFSKVLAAYEFKQAFLTTTTGLFTATHPEFEIVRGLVGARYPQRYVQVLGTRTTTDVATMSATHRTRDHVVELETQWFVFEPGMEDADRAAEDYLFARIGELEKHIRVNDIHLGGTVLECWLDEIVTDEQRVEEAGTAKGRLAAAIVTWRAKVRISNQ